jgi:hypothetical protein
VAAELGGEAGKGGEVNNDQWFQPGDKVIRVASICHNPGRRHPGGAPQFGKVYVIRDCWTCEHGYNRVSVVGFSEGTNSGGFRAGWVATNFRKVEEIRLCIEAVKKAKAPKDRPEFPVTTEAVRETARTLDLSGVPQPSTTEFRRLLEKTTGGGK